jgi:hypothetical protein
MDFIIEKLPSYFGLLMKALFFVALSVLVVPAMIIMVTLHKKWEDIMKEITQINPF